METWTGRLIGQRYRLTGFIAGGGMGAVYQAEDTRLANKVVAVKIITQSIWAEPDKLKGLRQRFEEEAQLSAILSGHPRIIQVTDYGIEENQPFLVMECLKGESLGDLLNREKRLSPERVMRLGIQLCDGFHYAHTFQKTLDGRTISGVLHRDIKPSNIFILRDDAVGEMVKILDFGIAKAISDISISLGTGMFIGTLSFSSPEQLRGKPLDARSDVYSLGLVLYQMLTGSHAFEPAELSFSGWYEAHNYEQPSSFKTEQLTNEVPTALTTLIMSCLEKDRENRPADMLTVKRQLQAILADPKPAVQMLETIIDPGALPPIRLKRDREPAPEPVKPILEATTPRIENPPPPPQKNMPWPLLLGGLGAVGVAASVVIVLSTPTPTVKPTPDPVVNTQPVQPKLEPKPETKLKSVPIKKPTPVKPKPIIEAKADPKPIKPPQPAKPKPDLDILPDKKPSEPIDILPDTTTPPS